MPTDVGLRVTQVERGPATSEQAAPIERRWPIGLGLVISGVASAILWSGLYWLVRHMV